MSNVFHRNERIDSFSSIKVVISILYAIGFGNPIRSWFNSFLINRLKWVKIFNTKSEVFLTTSGVPQDGHLSHLLFSLFVNSTSSCIKYSQLLCFANGMKIFLKINSVNDCLKLQGDLNSFYTWTDILGLTLNIKKFRSMILTKSQSLITFSYTLNGSKLLSLDSNISDIFFTFTPSLCYRAHIDLLTCKTFKVMGFIKRIVGEFKLTNSLKSIYCVLVRPIVKYDSVVWDPQTADASKQLERVRRKFLCFVKYALNITSALHDYMSVFRFFNISSLADRRQSYNLSFLHKLLEGSLTSLPFLH